MIRASVGSPPARRAATRDDFRARLRTWLRTGRRSAALAALALALTGPAFAGCGGDTPQTAPVAPPDTVPAGPQGDAPAPLVPGEVVVAEAVVAEVVAYADPSVPAPELARLTNPTVNGGPLVFQVTILGDQWHQVLLPVRPNGSVGWIRADSVTLSRNPYRIEIDVSDHRLVVYQLDAAIETTTVGIGTGATPTPVGSFYLTELLAPPDPSGPYGPYAFGLSGYSETLQTFNGGDAIIGIHGTDDPASLGTDVSHGCIRVANDVITELAGYLPLGTPVVIRA